MVRAGGLQRSPLFTRYQRCAMSHDVAFVSTNNVLRDVSSFIHFLRSFLSMSRITFAENKQGYFFLQKKKTSKLFKIFSTFNFMTEIFLFRECLELS